MLLVVVGAVMIVMAVLSRLFALSVYRRISRSPSRDVTPSWLPGTPWFAAPSDRQALRIMVGLTYGSAGLGLIAALAGAVAA